MKCILCGSETKEFKTWKEKAFVQCTQCLSVMLTKKSYISLEKEKQRYEEHNNDVEDVRYQKFVSPIVRKVLKEYTPHHKGLDFGSGTGPVITKLLHDQHYAIDIYDPFFANDKEKLNQTYDYIVCCEVMEHFHHPYEEFNRLKSLLKAGGTLYLMTKIYGEHINFDSWNYKNDPTHVILYHEKALEYIQETFKFSHMTIEGDFISYKNP